MKINFKSRFTIILSIIILLSGVMSGVATTLYMKDKKAQESKAAAVNSYKDIKLLEKSYDSVQIGDAASETAHRLEKTGTVAAEVISNEIGLVKNTFNTMSFQKKSDSMTCYMDISKSTAVNTVNPVVLEIEEVHTSNFLAFGYTVSIDDKVVFFRNYEQLITGSENVYVHINREDIKDPKNIKVTVSSVSDSKFTISKMNLYSDFYQMAETQGLFSPMGVNVFVDDKQLKDLNSVLAQYKKDYQSFKIGVTTDYAFIQSSPTDMATKMESYLNAGRLNNMPFHIMPARWWGDTAYTVDGLGGYFSDLKYNEVVYNPVTKSYQMTTPNQWANTPWPSMNDPQVNKVGAVKIQDFSTYFSNRYALMQAKYPEATNPYYFIMEWGSGYWIVYNLMCAGGDFADVVIADAAKDGVTLNPEDGLSDTEKVWMFKNVARYNEIEAKAYKAGLGTNSIVINKGQVQYPAYQLQNNLYSHTIQGTLYPSYNDRIPGWTSGVTSYNWPSSEMYIYSDQRHYDYSMATGKIADTNLEMTIVTKIFFQDFMKKCYANGMEFLTMFNAKKNEEGMYIKQIDKLEDKPFDKEITYNQNILDLNFLRDNNKGYENTGIPGAVKMTGLTLTSDGRLRLADKTNSGEILLKTSNPDGFKNGVNLEIEGQVQMNGKLSFYAGTDINNLTLLPEFKMGQKIDFFNTNTLYKADLGKDKAGSDLYVKIVFEAVNFPEGALIGAVRVNIPWSMKTGHQNGQVVTYKNKRIQSLNTQYRVVAQRLLAQYLEKTGVKNEDYNKAEALYQNAQYMDAVRYLTASLSEAIPASFSINSFGKLGKYPVEVKLESDGNTAVAKLLKATGDEIQVQFVTDKIQDATITVSGLQNKQKYMAIRTGENLVEIKMDATGEYPKNGTIVFKTKIMPAATSKITGDIEGVATNASENSVTLEIQDPRIGNYSYGTSFIFASNCTFKRYREGSLEITTDKPRKSDYVLAKLNENGSIISVEARYGTISGTVKTYYKPELKGENKTNGVIELTNGMKFELSYGFDMTNFNMVSLSGRAKDFAYDILRDAIKPGMVLTIDYIPGTYNNTNRRIINITQNVITLLEEDYEGKWETRIWSKKNIKAAGLDANYTFKVLQPDITSTPSEVVYKFVTTRPVDNASLTYSGRAIMNDSNGVKFYVSLDEKNWTMVEELNTNTFESNIVTKARNVDFSKNVAGSTAFYLKAEIYSTIETWGSLNDLTVKAVTK